MYFRICFVLKIVQISLHENFSREIIDFSVHGLT